MLKKQIQGKPFNSGNFRGKGRRQLGAGLAWSRGASICLEARLILPFNYRRKRDFNLETQGGSSECEDQRLWCFQQAHATTASPGAGASRPAGFINSARYLLELPTRIQLFLSSIAAYLLLFKPEFCSPAGVCNLLPTARAQTQSFNVPAESLYQAGQKIILSA